MEGVENALSEEKGKKKISSAEWLTWLNNVEEVNKDLISFCKEIALLKKEKLEGSYIPVSEKQFLFFRKLETRCFNLLEEGKEMTGSLDSTSQRPAWTS